MFPISHQEYEATHPVDAAHELEYEQARRVHHVRVHGSLNGYRPLREFPCPGTLDAVDRGDALWLIACDGCRFEQAIRNPERPSRRPEPEAVGSYYDNDERPF